ncbi:DUF3010 family protein [Aliiglaciecola lipolytica]|uniref:DUF3010 domain-containing protein n=1 Tax=Aliiglaciecola lipolytica E3 TaxID=1127673 RepID=K6YBE9_9ALTE|nr:DUF3010 family protein [Aliiglaciecola lipolytica]GAC15512.1 hypothetical protein GLIP_2891 [Aliiglaciecola lipolytica E3]
MRICGVEMKGSEANLCLLSLENDVFHIPDCRARKLTFPKNDSTEDVREFQFAFKKLMEDYKVDAVAIRERPTKGKFAGSAAGFKMEAAIQLIEKLNVTVLTPTHIKEILKRNPIPVAFSETGLKMFQEVAFSTAFASLMKEKYGIEEAPTE